jgi:hypothetical protein
MPAFECALEEELSGLHPSWSRDSRPRIYSGLRSVKEKRIRIQESETAVRYCVLVSKPDAGGPGLALETWDSAYYARMLAEQDFALAQASSVS